MAKRVADRVPVSSSSDHTDLTQLLYHYAAAMDRRDIEGVLACFTADAETSWHGGSTIANGDRALREFLEHAFSDAVLGRDRSSHHLMSNVLIAALDSDRAEVETTALACLTYRDGLVVVRGLHYSDVCVHDLSRGWLIARRAHRCDWEFDAPGRVGNIAAPGVDV